MNHDFEYINMKSTIDRFRSGLGLLKEEINPNQEGGNNQGVPAQPNVMDNKDSELQQRTVNQDNSGKKITLDNNKTATVVTDSQELDEKMTSGLQQILNGYLEAIQGSVTNTDLITVHIGDSAMTITVKVMMSDNQPATISVNSESQNIQLKYDNFLELNQKNLALMTQTLKYFNPNLMSDLQGAISIS